MNTAKIHSNQLMATNQIMNLHQVIVGTSKLFLKSLDKEYLASCSLSQSRCTKIYSKKVRIGENHELNVR